MSVPSHRRSVIRRRSRLRGAIEMWNAIAANGVAADQERAIAAAVGVPYVAVALLNAASPLTLADLAEWLAWPEREDFLVGLRSLKQNNEAPESGNSPGLQEPSHALQREKDPTVSFASTARARTEGDLE